MKKTMLGLAVLGLASTLTVAGTHVFGQESRGLRERGAGAVDRPAGRFVTARLARILDLTETQRESARTIVDAHLENVQPLRDAAGEAREAVRAQIESAADPTAIGNAVLNAREIGAEWRAATANLRSALREVLTPEPQERLDGRRDLFAPADDAGDARRRGGGFRGRLGRRAL